MFQMGFSAEWVRKVTQTNSHEFTRVVEVEVAGQWTVRYPVD